MRYLTFTAFIFLLSGFLTANAQFRDGIDPPIHPEYPEIHSGSVSTSPMLQSDQLFGLFDFNMSHSYEMTMGSAGGQTFNQNYYTNTMNFLFNDRLQGRVDLSVAHSPFGNNFLGESQGPQFFVRNAMLSYDVTDNTNITFQFRQIPGGMYNPYGFGSGFYGHGHSRFHSRGFHRQSPFDF
ncbi:MAG: hypothetical protein LAT67_14570 [Balneolales bacterium]|nr:hypothetical protein [Balneolales bacterium]